MAMQLCMINTAWRRMGILGALTLCLISAAFDPIALPGFRLHKSRAASFLNALGARSLNGRPAHIHLLGADLEELQVRQ